MSRANYTSSREEGNQLPLGRRDSKANNVASLVYGYVVKQELALTMLP